MNRNAAQNNRYDLIVIGGGAAGMMAAGSAAFHFPGRRVLLLEKMEKTGRKIRITGKGRCNLTNDKSREEFLSKVRGGAAFVAEAFDAFSNTDTIAFFEKQGLRTQVRQGGRIYPASDDAWEVVSVLERYCKEQGVEILCDTPVLRASKKGELFELEVGAAGKRVLFAQRLIIATGGKSYPRTGSTGDGYAFAHGFGHSIDPVRPSLVPFDVASPFLKEAKGTLLKNILLRLETDGEIVAEVFGELEFFSFGVGGATVFRLSRDAVDALDFGKKVRFVVDLKPALSVQQLLGRISRELQEDGALTFGGLIAKLIPRGIRPMVVSAFGKPTARVSGASAAEVERLIAVIKNFPLEVVSDRGFAEAVVTAGGVCLDEVDPHTMASRLCEGLFFAGEVLDIDADTGGYNLQLAFSTGYVAGKNVFEI